MSMHPGRDYDSSFNLSQESQKQSPGLLREIWDLLRFNKKWWLMPIVIVLLLAGVLVMLSGTVFAPFIYPLF